MRSSLRPCVARLACAVATMVGAASAPAGAQAPAAAPPDTAVAPARTRGPTDRAEMEAFMDGLMTASLRDRHIAGATVAVVKDGALFFAKGYGYADVDARTPVVAERTLFRIGSVSKLFTWTAVMQLVEEGKLDLDADVNGYLDFEIPATYPQPITLRHVLTHTAGFEEDSRDLIGEDTARLVPLREALATRMPARVRPPGTYSSYSNYATALAGHVVARVSGLSWDEYVERRILQPLGMQRTTGRQPLPARFAADMSHGYAYQNGRFVSKPWELITGLGPAGSMSGTATDMATFMLAHLADGAVGAGRILQPATLRLMHERTFGHDPRLPGFALGFYEKSSHGLRIIGHGGDTGWFHTDLALIPAEGVGVFVSYNTDTGGELSFGPFVRQFLDHYYPVTPPPAALSAEAAAEAERVAGEYQFNRASYTTFQKAVGLTGTIRVSATDSGALLMKSPLGDMRLVPVGPMLYREELGHGLVAFQADSGSGEVTHGFLGIAPMMALERVPWYQTPRLHWVLLGLAAVTFLLTLGAAVTRLVRQRFGTPRPGDALPGRWLVVGAALPGLAFLVAVGVLASDTDALLTRPTTGLRVALGLPVIAALLALGAIAMGVRHWRSGTGTRGARLRYAAVVVVTLLFVWSLSQWNLLGWQM